MDPNQLMTKERWKGDRKNKVSIGHEKMTQMAISRKIVLTHNSNHLCETITLATLCCFSSYQNIVETDNINILILYRIIAIPQFRASFRASHF